MKIEAMANYPGEVPTGPSSHTTELSQVQNQIAALTEKMKEFTIPKPSRTQVWC
nr:hypothetical protein Q903MT_gene2299 [Picea sitchensis]